jgi:hypothetical protein
MPDHATTVALNSFDAANVGRAPLLGRLTR